MLHITLGLMLAILRKKRYRVQIQLNYLSKSILLNFHAHINKPSILLHFKTYWAFRMSLILWIISIESVHWIVSFHVVIIFSNWKSVACKNCSSNDLYNDNEKVYINLRLFFIQCHVEEELSNIFPMIRQTSQLYMQLLASYSS